MKLLLLLLILIGSTNTSFSQNHSIESSRNGLDNFSIPDGRYRFTYNGTTHEILLMVNEGAYFEYDEFGTKIGSGALEKNGNHLLVLPENITTFSIVNANFEISLASIEVDVVKINLLLSDTISEELELIKL